MACCVDRNQLDLTDTDGNTGSYAGELLCMSLCNQHICIHQKIIMKNVYFALHIFNIS